MTVEEWLGEDNKIGIDIWNKKYRSGNETFEEWLDRVSGCNLPIKALIRDKKFLFGGRILANRGLCDKGKKITYSNCYVATPPDDNIESIFDCAKKLARTYSYGGGAGVDISNLSPRGAKIHNAAKTTSGAVSFMNLYSLVTGLIGQEGRRGALMISLSCDHPDIEEFINVKNDLTKVTSANISVRITDEFMEAVKKDGTFTLKYMREATGEVLSKTVKARDLFAKMAENNWRTGEPGMLFWDRIKSWNLLSNTEDFEYAGTNPCAEEPLPAGGSCLLGSINLSAFVDNPYTKEAQFNFEMFEYAVQEAVVALNEVLDEGMSLHPLDEQRKSVRDWRQIGLGIMGLADMLIMLGIEYGSDSSLDICREISGRMIYNAIFTSSILAKRDGCYPKCKIENVISTPFYKEAMNSMSTFGMDEKAVEDLIKENGIRNSQLLTIAPTGTLSTMLGISGGIEPIFSNSYTRTTKSLFGSDVKYKVFAPVVEAYMKANNVKSEDELPAYFVTAQSINYKGRIKMQSAWQEHVDASISSTVNAPNDFTVEDVQNLYMLAWESGLKGITFFRDGCERKAILEADSNAEKKTEAHDTLCRGDIIVVNDNVIGLKRKLQTGCGTLHVTAFFDPISGDLLETFFSRGSTGGCENSLTGLSRMISLAARGGISLDDIIDQLDSSGVCPSYSVRRATKKDTSKGSCCPTAIGNVLREMHNEFLENLKDGLVPQKEELPVEIKQPPTPKVQNDELCPECGAKLDHEGGCVTCKKCGFSRCG